VPIVAVTQPVPVSPAGGFDYVTIDSARGRVYAAHPGGGGLMIADSDTGNIIGVVPVGPMAGVAVDAATGHVFTGNGDARSVSEVDPQTQQILRTAIVDGPVDAIAYDPDLGRIYADEDDGTRVFVIDTKTFKKIATINIPGHKPEYIQVDPQTHDVYQNIASNDEIAVIDPKTLKVSRILPTPQLKNNHPLQYDADQHLLIAGGENNVLAVYDRSGKLLHQATLPGSVDQCSWEPTHQWIACAGNGGVTLFSFDGTSDPKLLDSAKIAPRVHTTAIDPRSGTIWVVWGDSGSAFVQGFTYRP
jgi:DNA-binding beta-propeller fold protein YncE